MADNVEPEPPPPPPDEVAVTQPLTPIPPGAPPPRQGCMAKRSTLEKILIVLVIIILIICVGIIAAFLVFYFFSTPPEGTCLTEQCVKSASRLERYKDDSVDPCNNFYAYACGGWLRSQVLEPDQTNIGLSSIISEGNNLKLRGILEKPISSKDQEYEKLPKLFYAACMNTEKQDERGSQPFLKFLETVGKFPSLDPTWNETDFHLESILIRLTKLVVQPLFQLGVQRDLKTSSVNRIYIADARLGLQEAQKYKNGRNDTRVRSYEKWLVESLVLLGVNRSNAEQDIRDVVDYEIKIAMLMRNEAEKSDLTTLYNPMTVAMLQSKYPWLKWQEYIQGVFTDPAIGGVVYISVEEQIINTEPAYLEKLGTLLSNTPKRVLANYLLSQLLTFTFRLGSKFEAIYNQFRKETIGTDPKPRSEQCVVEATNVFADSISRIYVDTYFSKDALDYMNVMITDLKTAFRELLDENKWMTEETKKKAHEKLNAMASKVGYPENILDNDRLNKLYTTIPAKEDEYLETVVASRQQKVSEQLKTLREAKDKSKWPVPAVDINAYYSFLENEIIFPAAFLQEPVYSPEYSSSMNYGAIGAIIGHEITHGFDNKGSKYNANGELVNWWTPKDSENFKAGTECFVDQYGCYKWDGVNLNGERTLGENIADNGGVKQSYRAYRNFVRRLGLEEQRLPGVSLNHNQIFFLSFAQVWCAKHRDEYKKEILESGVHTPALFRVLGTLQNSQEFADAFQCRQGSRMNPLRKCVLW